MKTKLMKLSCLLASTLMLAACGGENTSSSESVDTSSDSSNVDVTSSVTSDVTSQGTSAEATSETTSIVEYESDWNEQAKDAFKTYLGDEPIPFAANGDYIVDVESYWYDYGMIEIYYESFNQPFITNYQNVLVSNGYELDSTYQMYSKELTNSDYFYLLIDIGQDEDDTVGMYIDIYVMGYYFEDSTTPQAEVNAFLDTDITIPEFAANSKVETLYFCLDVTMYGSVNVYYILSDTTTAIDDLIALFQAANWTINDELVDQYGAYLADDPTGTIEIQFGLDDFDGDGTEDCISTYIYLC